MAIDRGFTGFEGGLFLETGNSRTVCDGTARTGDFMCRLTAPAAASCSCVVLSGQLTQNDLLNGESSTWKMRFAVRFRQFLSAEDSVGGQESAGIYAGIKVDNAGMARVRGLGTEGSQFGPLSLNVWYVVELEANSTRRASGNINDVTHDLRVYLEDGTLVGSSTVSTFYTYTTSGLAGFTLGNWTTKTGDIEYDDVFYARATRSDVATAVFPPFASNRISPVLVTAQGASADFTGDYRNVNDRPYTALPATAQTSSTNGHTTTFTKQTAEELNLGNVYATAIRVNASAGSAGNDAAMWNGAEIAIALTTAAITVDRNLPSAIDWTALSASAWDAAEVGFRNKRGAATSLHQCYLEVLHDSDDPAARPEVVGEGSWRHKTGVYTGNGDFQEITGLGFRPSFVFIKRSNTGSPTSSGAWKTRACGGTASAGHSGSPASFANNGLGNMIMRFTADGFEIGPNDGANGSGAQYFYLAIRDGGLHPDGAYMRTGSYMGTGVDDTAIEIEAGFQPELLLVFGSTAGVVWRDADHSTTDSMIMTSSATVAGMIKSLDANGFTIGTANINTARQQFHYLAIRRLNDLFDPIFARGIFTAAASTHTVTGLLFQPSFVAGDRPATTDAAWRSSIPAAHAGADSSQWNTQTIISTGFTSLTADGFTVGSALAVSGQTARWFALIAEAEIPWIFDEVEFEDEQDGTTIGLHWVHFYDRADAEHVWSKVDLADAAEYYGGFKSGIVTRWGTVKRALSDRRGQYEASSFSWTVSDVTREIRGMLANAATRFFTGCNAIVRSIPDAMRRLELRPRTVVRGIVRGYRPLSPMLFEFTAEDYFAAQFQVGTEEQQLPRRRIGRVDFPACPIDAIGEPVPIVYGAIGVATSATAPPIITGITAEGAYSNEGFWINGFGERVSDAAIPANVIVGLDAGGTLSIDVPNGEYGILVSAVDASGRESDPHVFYTDGPGVGRGSFAAGPLSPSYVVAPDGTQKITVSWDASAGAVSYRVYLGVYYFGVRFLQLIETASLSTEFTAGPAFGSAGDITPGASPTTFREIWQYVVTAMMGDGETSFSAVATGVSQPFRRGILLRWLPVVGATGYRIRRRSAAMGPWDRRWTVSSAVEFFEDDLLDTGVEYLTSDDAPRGGVPVRYVGQIADSSAILWEAFVVCGHAVKDISAWYLDGVRVDAGTAGVTWCVPGQAGFATYFPDTGSPQYRDINGRRYTLIYLRGPDGSDAAAGTKKVTLDVEGIEDVGDGSGDLITSIALQYLHALQNWLIGDYQSGAWLDSPTMPDDPTLPQIDEDSFAAVEAVLQSRIAGGYTGAGIIGADGDLMSLRDIMARFHVSGDFEGGFNRFTQFMIAVIDDDAAAVLSTALNFDQVSDIIAGSFNVEDEVDKLFNAVPFSYARDWTGLASEDWLEESEESSADSIANYRETRRSERVYLWFIRSPAVATDIAQRRLLLSSDPPRIVKIRTGLRALNVELGDVITITHADGIGADGWSAHPIRVIRHEFDPDGYTVALEGLDMAKVYDGAFILGDETALPAWTAGTATDRSYGYLADETTEQFSDDAPIKRLR